MNATHKTRTAKFQQYIKGRWPKGNVSFDGCVRTFGVRFLYSQAFRFTRSLQASSMFFFVFYRNRIDGKPHSPLKVHVRQCFQD